MRKVLKLTLALAVLATAGTGMLSPKRAEANCPMYCCPNLRTLCAPCCFKPCGLNCP